LLGKDGAGDERKVYLSDSAFVQNILDCFDNVTLCVSVRDLRQAAHVKMAGDDAAMLDDEPLPQNYMEKQMKTKRSKNAGPGPKYKNAAPDNCKRRMCVSHNKENVKFHRIFSSFFR